MWTAPSPGGLECAPQSSLTMNGAEGASELRLAVGIAAAHPIDSLCQRIKLQKRLPSLRRAALPLAALCSLRRWLGILQARAVGCAVVEEGGKIT